MTEEEILAEVLRYPTRHVVFTGGEPSLQLTASLVDKLHAEGRFVQVETNGTHHLPTNIDWLTCSPKYKPVVYSQVDELKVVYESQDMSQYDHIQAKDRYLQPCSCKNTDDVINFIKENPTWKLSLQTQKLLNIR